MAESRYSEIVHELYNLSAQGVESSDVRFRQLYSALSSAREQRGPLQVAYYSMKGSSRNPVNSGQFQRILDQIDAASNYIAVGLDVPPDLLDRCGVGASPLYVDVEPDRSSTTAEILHYAEVLHRSGDRWGPDLAWLEYRESLSETTLSYTLGGVSNLRALLEYALSTGTPESLEGVEVLIRELGMEGFVDRYRSHGVLPVDQFMGALLRLERQLRLLSLQRNFKRTLRMVRHLCLSDSSSADSWHVRSGRRGWGEHIAEFIGRSHEADRVRQKLAVSVSQHAKSSSRRPDYRETSHERVRILKLPGGEGSAHQRAMHDAKQHQFHVLCSSAARYMCSIPTVCVTNTADDDVECDSPLRHQRGVVYTLHNLVIEDVKVPPSLFADDVLRDYHIEGLRWLLCLYNNSLNGVLADDYELNRVLHVVLLFAYLKDMKDMRGPHIVILPLPCMQTAWRTAFEEWYPSCRVCYYEGSKMARKEIRGRWIDVMTSKFTFDVLVTTDHVLALDRNYLKRIKWEYAVVDGVSHLRHPQGYVLQAVNPVFSFRRRLITMSSAPQCDTQELWSVLNFLFPEMFSTIESFDAWFHHPLLNPLRYDVVDYQITPAERSLVCEIFNSVLTPFMLRRPRHVWFTGPTMYIEHLVYCPMSGVQTRLFNFVKDKHMGADKWSMLQAVCTHPYVLCQESFPCDDTFISVSGKFTMLDVCLSRLVPAKHRILIIAPASPFLDLLEVFMHMRCFKYLRVDESMHPDQRAANLATYNGHGMEVSCLLSVLPCCANMLLVNTDTVVYFDGSVTSDYVAANNILNESAALLLRLCIPHVTDEPYLLANEVPPPVRRSRPKSSNSRRSEFTSATVHDLSYLDVLLTRSMSDERQFYLSCLSRFMAQRTALFDEQAIPVCLFNALNASGSFQDSDMELIKTDETRWYSALDGYDIWSANPSKDALSRSHAMLNPESLVSEHNTITSLPLGYPIDRAPSMRGFVDSMWLTPLDNQPQQRIIVINDLIKKALGGVLKVADYIMFTEPYMKELYGGYLHRLSNPVNLNDVLQLAEAGAFPSVGGLNMYLERLCSNVRDCHGHRSRFFYKSLECFYLINHFILREIPISFLWLSDNRSANELHLLYDDLRTLYK